MPEARTVFCVPLNQRSATSHRGAGDPTSAGCHYLLVRWHTEFVRLQLVDEQVNRGLAEQTGLVYSHYLQEAFKSEDGRRPGEFRRANTFRSRVHAVAVNGGWKPAGPASSAQRTPKNRTTASARAKW